MVKTLLWLEIASKNYTLKYALSKQWVWLSEKWVWLSLGDLNSFQKYYCLHKSSLYKIKALFLFDLT